MEVWLSQFCGKRDVITEIDEKDELIRKKRGYRGPQNNNIPLKKYDIRHWAKYIVSRKRPREFKNHDSALRIRKFFTNEFKNYFTFCIERNPWQKSASHYEFTLRKNNLEKKDLSITGFLKLKGEVISDWNSYTDRNDNIVVDRVFQYGKIEKCKEFISKIVSTSNENMDDLPHAKKGRRDKSYRSIMCDKSKRIVKNICKKEIDHFGYTF
ncbi:hypothetical protein GGP53_002820 [Salinibacter ruber]|uniref:hypothetical protein n=1 Tax=Salinibacter ruber TaxID=146919 RepID=UPI002168B653|nr:hypothetical protein [Salinibacter ruber]MCS3628941.1 hypothetical protein [Salinibacter ruber]MCS4145850.1 hypothetical protein [Salinibacter ruber]